MKETFLTVQLSMLNRLQGLLLKKLEERASDPLIRAIPGGSTGLLVRREVRSETGEKVVRYELDVATLRKLLSINERARVLEEVVTRNEARPGWVSAKAEA